MFRISKRASISFRRHLMIKTSAILLALLTLAIFLMLLGHNPIKVYGEMINGSLGSAYRVKETIKIAIPLTMTAIGILLAFKMKFWNIGAEGQIMMGAIGGTYIALYHTYLPTPILLLTMLVVAAVLGGLWALIPGFFKVRYDSNETLFTLMMNYIAIKIVVYLQFSLWKDPNGFGFAKIAQFDPKAVFPSIFGVHIGWVITILLVAVVYLLINHTKLGYEICVVGSSKNTAKYAGMNVDGTILKTVFLSGAIAGIVGIVQASAINGTLSVDVSGGYGFTAIIIAWLSGMSTLIIPITAFLFAILTQGAMFIQTAFQIPQSVAEILQAMILIFALGSEFFTAYEIKRISLKDRKAGAYD
ncbi:MULTISPECIES: ABC transporter permease [unclassified Fusibacter]|uniref:ABC transporter permease n=1 Tax=unclassified Fusibacter TaxID=2624464 RepID=UPI00101286E5|nr:MULTISPECIES: ABC transporter permease [unclassified Fusibacter]MCK8059951.1 ABC transporter permease [Fusibacter sp. A2]NPE22093.1 ABC transporter permease [Fusibacter sp. A1]RXV60872.1 ABC transporter permease [Fusibacter sp. A1]